MRSITCKQKFLLKQNEGTDAEKISHLPEPIETPRAKLVPEPRCARPQHRHLCHQATEQQPHSGAWKSRSEENSHREFHPDMEMKFKGRTETRKEECNRTTGLTGRWRGRQVVVAVAHCRNQSEIKSWNLTVIQIRWVSQQKTQGVRQEPEIGMDHTTGQQQWAPLGFFTFYFTLEYTWLTILC